MQVAKKNITEYDLIRVIGTVLVVVGHSAYTTMITETGGIEINVEYGSLQTIILLFIRLIYSFHMPMFIALSGALFYLTKTYERTFYSLFKQKTKRLLIPFIIISCFWSIPLKTISGYWQNSILPIHDIILGQFIRFDNNYLWYLISLFWLFCIFWFLFAINTSPIFISLICLICFAVGQKFSYNYFGIQRALTHMIWFNLGIIYEKWCPLIKNFMGKILYQICFIFISILIYFSYLSVFKNNVYIYAVVAFSGMGCVYIIALYLHKIKFENLCVYTIIKRYSFEIYLLSDPLNYLILTIIKKMEMLHFYRSNLFCVCIFLTRIILTIIISIIIALFINKLKRKVLKNAIE